MTGDCVNLAVVVLFWADIQHAACSNIPVFMCNNSLLSGKCGHCVSAHTHLRMNRRGSH